jgi:hypothetical protein
MQLTPAYFEKLSSFPFSSLSALELNQQEQIQLVSSEALAVPWARHSGAVMQIVTKKIK